MSLQRLPDELIESICLLCDISEIKNLRLTSRALCKIANDHLLSEVVVFMNHDSLKICRRIADHPVFSHKVKSLWIQADRPEKPTAYEWDENRKLVYGEGPIGTLTYQQQRAIISTSITEIYGGEEQREHPTFSEKQYLYFSNHYKWARRLWREAEAMLKDQSFYSSIRALFTYCPNIKAVDLTMQSAIRENTTKNSEGFRRGLISPIGEDHINFHRAGVETFAQMLHAASDACFRPRYLRLGHISHYIFTHRPVHGELQRFFRELEELEWHFSIPYMSKLTHMVGPGEMATITSDFNAGRFLPLMESASCLRRLHLKLPRDSKMKCGIWLSSLVGNLTLSALNNLHLSGFVTEAVEFVHFLLRHADTLKNVHFADVHLRGSCWIDCFGTIAGNLPNVEKFELRGRFVEKVEFGYMFYLFEDVERKAGNDVSPEMETYLITGGQECPLSADMRQYLDVFDRSDDDDDEPDFFARHADSDGDEGDDDNEGDGHDGEDTDGNESTDDKNLRDAEMLLLDEVRGHIGIE